MRTATSRALALLASAVIATACATHNGATQAHGAPTGAPASAASVPDGDWTTFDYNAQRTGAGPGATGITAQNLHSLKARVLHINGEVDASAIQLHAVRVRGRVRDVIIVTSIYGQTIALDPATGAHLWEFTPRSTAALQTSPQITQSTPVADPGRAYVYTLSPDGYAHKLALATGHQVWATRLTFDAAREKVDTLNFGDGAVIVATGGYDGDAPPYQGHVVALDPADGHILHVWNSLCANRHYLIDPPSSCPASDSAIWARAGVLVEPGSGRLLLATGNAPFNGSTNWGDSVLELSRDAGRVLHNWTPSDQAADNANDADVGSTAPALLPGGLALQGGKPGRLWLLDLNRLDGTTHGAGRRLGGELQTLSTPNGSALLTAPAVWTSQGRTYVFVANDSGTEAFVLKRRRLHEIWSDGTPGTSPVVAGGLLYIYDEVDGTLFVRRPSDGFRLAALPAAAGHWNSPIVVGGRIILPTGNGDNQGTSGTIFVWHLPGR